MTAPLLTSFDVACSAGHAFHVWTDRIGTWWPPDHTVTGQADLIVLDTRRAHLVPAGRIVSAWIHNGQPSDIESSMVDGQFIMRNRKVLTMDEDRIIAEADTVGRRIWTQVQAAGAITVPGRSRRR